MSYAPIVLTGLGMLTAGILVAFVALLIHDRRPWTRNLSAIVWSGVFLTCAGTFLTVIGFLAGAADAL